MAMSKKRRSCPGCVEKVDATLSLGNLMISSCALRLGKGKPQ
jgi:hypothetical protein